MLTESVQPKRNRLLGTEAHTGAESNIATARVRPQHTMESAPQIPTLRCSADLEARAATHLGSDVFVYPTAIS
jgi:hypothetical protein